MINSKIIIILLYMALFFILGCTEKYGDVSPAYSRLSVREVVMNPSLEGKGVLVEGKILTQCLSSGCWFILQDATGRMVVDLKHLNLGLPQKTGKKVVVSGIVSRQEGGQVIIQARGLIIS